MKQTATNRIIIAWLLSVILVIPQVVKSVHGFEECHLSSCFHTACSTDADDAPDNHHEHNCDDCAICCFMLPFFTKTEQSPYFSVIRELNTIISPDCREDIYIPFISTYSLRAPPGWGEERLIA